MFMFGKKKIKISDASGTKLDSAVITNEKEADEVFSRWKKKGLF